VISKKREVLQVGEQGTLCHPQEIVEGRMDG
jgi:hypothetical protein